MPAPNAPDRWPEVARILDEVLELAPEERAAFLDRACADDPELRTEVEAMLRGAEADSFLKSPAAVFGAELLEDAVPFDSQLRLTGEMVGSYRLVRELGHGGMGVVYLAERADGQFEQQVALKLIRRGMASAEVLQRFLAERRVLARLNHPRIARLLDGGITATGQPWFAMEYVEGVPLTRYCDERGLGVEERLTIFEKVCEAVQYAHQNRLVHRDLKPSNILVTPSREVKLLDFGIAKALREQPDDVTVTRTGDRWMTPEYAAPEQIRGEPVTIATDVYALGAILYLLLTGQPAHRLAGLSQTERDRVICEVPPERPSAVASAAGRERLRRRLAGDLDTIVLMALRKEPQRRYASVAALLDDLQRHRTGLPVHAQPDSVTYRTGKFLGRHWTTIKVAALVTLVVSAGLVGTYLGLRAREPEELVASAARRIAFESALELDPVISPDDRSIVFAADYEGPMRLYVLQPGGRRRAITNSLPGYHRAPRWSPDSRRIAFQSGGTIYAVSPNGGKPSALVTPPSGGWVAFPAWSPDGREIAYVQDWAVYARPIAGGEPRRLVPRGGWPHSLTWSPDGQWIAFVEGNGTFAYGAKPWGSPMNLGNVAPSAIWVVPANGGEPVQVTDDRALNTSPVWLPRGRGLLFVSNRQGERDIYRVDLKQNGRPAGPPGRITVGLDAQTISLASDGRRVAYAVYQHTSNIWSVPIPASGDISVAEARPVTSGNQAIEGLALSPDGSWLAFDSDRSGNQDIYRIPVAGGDPVQLTSDSGDDFMSSWSPEGKEIAYYSHHGGTRQLRVMSADGKDSRPVVPLPPDQRFPGWSPDGMGLVFSSDATGRMELYSVGRNSDSTWRAALRLTFDGGSAGRWSPDGKEIAFIRSHGIWLLRPPTGNPRPLLRVDPATAPAPEVLQWSPDGRTIYYKAFDAEGQSSIWALPATGGTPRLVIRFDDPARQSSRPEFATDGKRLFFTMTEREADIWEMELHARK